MQWERGCIEEPYFSCPYCRKGYAYIGSPIDAFGRAHEHLVACGDETSDACLRSPPLPPSAFVRPIGIAWGKDHAHKHHAALLSLAPIEEDDKSIDPDYIQSSP
jgi:hypothetical protein